MKKLVVFPFLFLALIPVFAQDKTLFAGNFSGIEYSGAYSKFIGLETSLPADNLLYAEAREYLKERQTCQSLAFSQLSNLTYLSNVTYAEKPPLNGYRIAGEILAGGVGGTLTGLLGVSIAESSAPYPIKGYYLDFLLAYPIGSAIGVYIVGNIGNETGSFGTTLGGSISGILIWIICAIGASNGDMPSIVPITVFFAAPPIFATIGFNETRRYKTPPETETGLLNFSERQMSLNVPTIYFRPDPFDGKKLYQNVDLVTIRF